MTLADLVVGQLRDAGVHTLFGVPGGGGNLDLIAAAGRAGLPFVLTSTETAAAIAALAQTEVTGAAGACLTTLGPGAASVTNGVACAFLERAPVVVFTDSHSTASRSALEHQTIDHSCLLRPITKSSATLTGDGALQAIVAALHTATAGRPGPVHLDCPGDVLSAQPPLVDDAYLQFEVDTPTHEDRSRWAATIAKSRKPLLIVGLGARRPEDAAIRAFCGRCGVPAMVTYKAKGVVSDGDPWFAGVFTNAAIEQPVLDESDLLIGVGLDPVELIPRPWKRQQPVIYCGRWRVDDGHVPFAAQLVAEIPDALGLLDDAVTRSDWDAARVRAHVETQRRLVDITAEGLTAQNVVAIAASGLADAVGRVTVDAGAHMFPATVLWPVREPNGLLISNGLSTMGFALPAAIGAALLDRDRPVVALTGDGGLLMCAGELLTAVREKLRIITLVFSDDSLSLIEIKQQARNLPPAGVALGAIDWPSLAGSFGMPAWTARNATDLERAVDAAIQCDGPSLIEAKIDRSNYGATLRAIRG